MEMTVDRQTERDDTDTDVKAVALFLHDWHNCTWEQFAFSTQI